MTLWQEYLLVQSVNEALAALANAPGAARFIAGGTDLLLEIQQGRQSPVHTLIDVTSIPEMCVLETRPDHLYIGASVPLNQIVESALVQEHAQALIEACSLIGGPQVRNTATLGGNVAHALPAGDGTIALLTLGAQAEVASLDGRSLRPIDGLFLGPGLSALEARHELLLGFALPLKKPGEASAFRRVMRPQGVAIAILNMGTWLRRDGNRIADLRLAVGPAAPTPFRACATESALRGQPLDRDTLAKAKQVLLAEASFRSSPHRATKDYRRHLVSVLLEEVLFAAWERTNSVSK